LAVTGTTSLTDDLAVDTDTLFVDASADRVGINKNNPAVALDVTGDITSSATITGTTLAGTLSTAAQTNVTSVGTLSSLAVSGNLTVDTDTLFVDAASNEVGIGTSSPGAKLEVKAGEGANFRVRDNGTDTLLLQNFNDTDGYETLQIAASNTAFLTGAAGGTSTIEIARFTTNGLTFNGDTAAANALDDYEEGTWTMGVAFSAATVGVTYTANTGQYTKIGRQVTVTGYFSVSDKGISSGNLSITGLPVAIAGGDSNYVTCSLHLDGGISYVGTPQAYGVIGTSTIFMGEINEAGAASALTDADCTAPFSFIVNMTYFT
jgi:hypothetical protein